MAGLQIKIRAYLLFFKSIENSQSGNTYTLVSDSYDPIGQGMMFMLTRSIFLRGQTPSRIDGWPQDYIWSIKVLFQIH
jgi:hypothetical protein